MASTRLNPIPSLVRWLLTRPAVAGRLVGRRLKASLPHTTSVAIDDDRRA